MIQFVFLSVFVFSASVFAQSKIIEFVIRQGTGEQPWNSPQEIVKVNVGDVLRIYNDDSVDHRLHTVGAPCGHGENIPARLSEKEVPAFWDCHITEEYDAHSMSPIYDHHYGETARFWITTK